MDFRTKEGEKANNWFTRSAYDAASGEDWVLEKDHADPRKRRWVKYDRNGKVVNRKTGALNIGGNLTQLGKGGLKNVGNLAQSLDIRDRVKDEGKPNPRNIDDYIDSFIGQLLDGAQNKEEEIEYLQFRDIHEASKQKKLIFAEQGKEATSLIPDDALSWARRGAVSTAGEAVEENITTPKGEQVQTNIQSGMEETGIAPPLPPIDTPEETPEQTAKREWLGTSTNTPAAKAFAEGTGQQQKAWGDLRWEARKRHK